MNNILFGTHEVQWAGNIGVLNLAGGHRSFLADKFDVMMSNHRATFEKVKPLPHLGCTKYRHGAYIIYVNHDFK